MILKLETENFKHEINISMNNLLKHQNIYPLRYRYDLHNIIWNAVLFPIGTILDDQLDIPIDNQLEDIQL